MNEREIRVKVERVVFLLESGLSFYDVEPMLKEIRFDHEPGLWPKFQYLIEANGWRTLRTSVDGIDFNHEASWGLHYNATPEELAELRDHVLLVLKACLLEPLRQKNDPFEVHCKLNPITSTFTHKDRAITWLSNHPNEQRTIEQLKRKSEELNSSRRKTR